MAQSLFFYDLETSGINPREDRVMQFGGQRTGMDLKPIGEPVNLLIRLSNDVLPSPQAILITGITPQATISEGLTEAEFLEYFHEEVSTPGTIFVGFNSVRFDDEFMRYMNYRNYYDPYEWQWKDNRGKWDLLDVVRMTRALRPDGINWPNDSNGKATNRLELLTKENNISHEGAHDALSDVVALIDVSKLLKDKQPKLFSYLLDTMRDKSKLSNMIRSGEPFVYTSGKYPSEFEKTTVTTSLFSHSKRDAEIVFDLRFDPTKYADMTVDELIALWVPKDKDSERLPVKTIQFNRCPAVAPLGVLDADSQKRIKLTLDEVSANNIKLKQVRTKLNDKLQKALKILNEKQDYSERNKAQDVDARLYDGFFSNEDRKLMNKLTNSEPSNISEIGTGFEDARLKDLLPLYKARNFPNLLDDEEIKIYEKFRTNKLIGGKENSRLAKFFNELTDLSQQSLDSNKTYLLEELKLYGESLIPSEVL